MGKTTQQAPNRDPVLQFSIFTANRIGRLHDLIHLFGRHQVHVLALTTLDTTDSTVIRIIVDDPQSARRLLGEHDFPFTECPVLVVAASPEGELQRALSALLEAELNIHYIYGLAVHPGDKSLFALNLEDREVAEHALTSHGFEVLRQADISR